MRTGWGLCSEAMLRIFGSEAAQGSLLVGRRSNEVFVEGVPALQPAHFTASLAWHTVALFPLPPTLAQRAFSSPLPPSTPRMPASASPRVGTAGGRKVPAWEQAYAADWDIRRHVALRRASLQLTIPASVPADSIPPGVPFRSASPIRTPVAPTPRAKGIATPRPASASARSARGGRRSHQELEGERPGRECGAARGTRKAAFLGEGCDSDAHASGCHGMPVEAGSPRLGGEMEVLAVDRCGALDLCRWGQQLQQAIQSRDAAELDAGIYGSVARTQAAVGAGVIPRSEVTIREERRAENRKTGLRAGDTAVPLTGLRRVAAPPGPGGGRGGKTQERGRRRRKHGVMGNSAQQLKVSGREGFWVDEDNDVAADSHVSSAWQSKSGNSVEYLLKAGEGNVLGTHPGMATNTESVDNHDQEPLFPANRRGLDASGSGNGGETLSRLSQSCNRGAAADLLDTNLKVGELENTPAGKDAEYRVERFGGGKSKVVLFWQVSIVYRKTL
jgi:hypothetical protein